jgi:hypothetical protein
VPGRPTLALLVVLALTATAGLPAAGQGAADRQGPPAVDAILEQAGVYVAKYFETLSNLLAEERYVQDLLGIQTVPTGVQIQPPITTRPPEPFKPPVPEVIGAERRQLRSDIVLIKVGPPLEWRMYRDVYEVDGRPVRDRANRLAKLLLEPAESARVQAERIAEESARFNISAMGRVLNEPGLALAFLQPSLRPRFGFTIDKRDRGNVWIVRYEETGRPTLFWHNRTTQNPSSGRFWIDVTTGEVTRAEHTVSQGITASFTTQFRHDDRFGISLPNELREELSSGPQANARKVTGVARYSNYKQFEVSTN